MSDSSSRPKSNGTEIVLYQFAFSHFNEKARWALDWKGVEADRQSLLPGFHGRTTAALSGSSETPVLTADEDVVAGSTAILRWLEDRQPSPPLFSKDSKLDAEIESWIAWLDDEVGPATRLGLFDELLTDAKTAAEIFSVGHQGLKRTAYKMAFPAMIPVLRSRMSINADSAAKANEWTDKALDRIAEAVRETGYLVGDRFSAADLTAASLLFPLSFPAELPFSMPDRPSAVLSHWKARWENHPGVAWMEEIFRKHR